MVATVDIAEIVERLRIQGTDDALVEVKTCARSLSKDVWETVSAFANTSGGLIICGLEESKGFAPVEKFDIDRVLTQFVTGMGDGGQPAVVANAPRYEMTRAFLDGAQVLLIEIEELGIGDKPCYIVARGIQGGSYKRVDDKDIKLSAPELYEMQSVLIPSDADGGIVAEATLDDLDEELVDAIITHRRRQSPRLLKGADTREQQMDRVNITNKVGGVRLAGLLAAGLYPQQYYPKLVIDVAVHPGREKAEPGAPRFLDRRVCDGPMAGCIEDALSVIGRNLRKASYVEGAGRRDEWEVPEEVLREALANAVIHREYSSIFLGEAVNVDVYPDRIEISNPGGLWGGKTADTIADGVSRCRNAKLMSLLSAVPLEHSEGYVAESQGSGIRTMIREMESRSLGEPKFVVKADSFKVILARHGVEIERNKEWLSAQADRELTREEQTLLMLLREHGGTMGVRDIRSALGWDSDDIREHCARFVSEGLFTAVGNDVYAVAEPASAGEGRHDEAASLTTASIREGILSAMAPGREMSAQELADHLDVPVHRVRYALPKLIDEGKLVPTAGVHSRHRKYLLS